jgi:hypothetical protein
MFILKKTPRQHGLNEPFRHENHPRPITRRQLMGAGFLAGPAVVLAPAWLGALLKSGRADAAGISGLDPNTLALRAECAIPTTAVSAGAGSAGPVPFITIDLAGGANLMGSEALAGMAGSPTNFISTAGYNKLGVPGTMVPTSSTFIDMSLGLPFHSDSAILRGIKAKVTSPTALAKVNGVVIPAISQNDTNSNPLNAMYLIAKALGGFGTATQYGQLVTLVGTNATPSGGNSVAPAAFIDTTITPSRVATSADNVALVGSSAGIASQDTIEILEAQERITGGTVMNTPQGAVGSATLVTAVTPPDGTSPADTAGATAADAALKKQVRCGFVKTANTAATSKGPDSVNPDKDPVIVGGTSSIFSATDYANGDFKKTAAVMKLVMNGFAGAGTIVLGGYDYHSGNRSDGETRNEHAGNVIGAIIAYAEAVQTPVMINIISDGSLTSTGTPDTSMAGRGKLGWQGDSQQVAASIILVYSPKGRPAAAFNQIGSLNSDGTVNATSSPGANAPNLVPQLVALNWMALNGIDANFKTVFGAMQGLGANTAALTAFTKIT